MKKEIFWKLLSFAAADKAGEAIRDILKSDKLDIVEKTGADDLQTKADRYANDLLCASIKKAFPQINVIGEEGPVDLNNIKPEMLVEGTYLFKLRPFKFLLLHHRRSVQRLDEILQIYVCFFQPIRGQQSS